MWDFGEYPLENQCYKRVRVLCYIYLKYSLLKGEKEKKKHERQIDVDGSYDKLTSKYMVSLYVKL